MKRFLLCGLVALSFVGLMVFAHGGRGGGGRGGHGWHGGGRGGWGGRGWGYGGGWLGRGWAGPGFAVGVNLRGRPYYNGCPSRRSCNEYPDREICRQCYPDLYE